MFMYTVSPMVSYSFFSSLATASASRVSHAPMLCGVAVGMLVIVTSQIPSSVVTTESLMATFQIKTIYN